METSAFRAVASTFWRLVFRFGRPKNTMNQKKCNSVIVLKIYRPSDAFEQLLKRSKTF